MSIADLGRGVVERGEDHVFEHFDIVRINGIRSDRQLREFECTVDEYAHRAAGRAAFDKFVGRLLRPGHGLLGRTEQPAEIATEQPAKTSAVVEIVVEIEQFVRVVGVVGSAVGHQVIACHGSLLDDLGAGEGSGQLVDERSCRWCIFELGEIDVLVVVLVAVAVPIVEQANDDRPARAHAEGRLDVGAHLITSRTMGVGAEGERNAVAVGRNRHAQEECSCFG